jgi:hypothetical protein
MKKKKDEEITRKEINRKCCPTVILSFRFYPCSSVCICGSTLFDFLVGAGFGGGVHAVLRNFVDAARGRFLVYAVKMI